jgi:hypothetical protein
MRKGVGIGQRDTRLLERPASDTLLRTGTASEIRLAVVPRSSSRSVRSTLCCKHTGGFPKVELVGDPETYCAVNQGSGSPAEGRRGRGNGENGLACERVRTLRRLSRRTRLPVNIWRYWG